MIFNSDRKPHIVLASRSSRREQLLQQIGVFFASYAVDIDETPLPNEASIAYVNRLSLAKAQAGWDENIYSKDLAGLPVLGADTSVVIDGLILGKPNDRADAVNMLKRLSGQRHQVLTSVSIATGPSQLTACSVTQVEFKSLTAIEIESYVDSGEPEGKAGSYAIQGFAAVFVQKISGSYSGVMGLPLAETYQLLTKIKML